MIAGIQATSAAMSRHERAQEVYARNLANVMTPGFKRLATTFQSIMANEDGGSPGAAGSGGDAQSKNFTVDFSSGPFVHTSHPYDLAVEGEGFFVMRTADGLRYTRDGCFRQNAQGQLINGRGDVLMGQGGPVTIPAQAKSVQVTGEGGINADGVTVDRIRLVEVRNPETMQPVGCSLFAPTKDVTKVADATDAKVHQGAYEASNVSPIQEMVSMMANFRSYEACSRAVRTIQTSESRLYQVV